MGLDQVGSIVKVLDNILFVSFWAVLGPTYKVFDSKALIFPDYAFIVMTVNFEGFVVVCVTLHKYRGELLRTRAAKRILGRA